MNSHRCSWCCGFVGVDGISVEVNDSPKYFCRSDCQRSFFEERSLDGLKRLVLERDRGVCAVCRQDCLKLRKELDGLQRRAKKRTYFPKINLDRLRRWESRLLQLLRCGFDKHAVENGHALWELDHIDPQVRGGRNTLANVRTLCLSCHKEATGSLASDRAKKRRVRR